MLHHDVGSRCFESLPHAAAVMEMNGVIRVCAGVKITNDYRMCSLLLSSILVYLHHEASSVNQPFFIRDYTEWLPLC